MIKYLLILILAVFSGSFSTVANGATVSGGQVFVLPQENFGGNSYGRERYNSQVRELNRDLQRQHDQQTLYNQNQQIINQLNQQEQLRKQREWRQKMK